MSARGVEPPRAVPVGPTGPIGRRRTPRRRAGRRSGRRSGRTGGGHAGAGDAAVLQDVRRAGVRRGGPSREPETDRCDLP